jgi:hypothetical protein
MRSDSPVFLASVHCGAYFEDLTSAEIFKLFKSLHDATNSFFAASQANNMYLVVQSLVPIEHFMTFLSLQKGSVTRDGYFFEGIKNAISNLTTFCVCVVGFLNFFAALLRKSYSIQSYDLLL